MRSAKYIICFLIFGYPAFAQTPNSWARVADFGGISRYASVSCSIDSFGYVALGIYDSVTLAGNQYPTDLWQYNPYTNIWTQKAHFPGFGRENASCFAISSKLYIGMGDENGTGSGGYSDFWEYDPSNDSWAQKANFGGGGRTGCLAFSIGGKGYVGMGYSDTSSQYKKDMWEYDAATDTWTRLGDFPGIGVEESALFNLGGQEYIGFGYHDTSSKLLVLGDLWRYDTLSDSWTQLANFKPDTIHGGGLGAANFAFAIDGKGYANVLYDSGRVLSSGGYISSYFYEYKTASDTWAEKDSFPDSMIFGSACFSIGNKGYVGIGSPNYITNCSNDFWMYTPDSLPTGISSIDESSISIFPDPASDRLYINNLSPHTPIIITDMLGQVMIKQIAETSKISIDVSALPPGVYCVNNRKFVKD